MNSCRSFQSSIFSRGFMVERSSSKDSESMDNTSSILTFCKGDILFPAPFGLPGFPETNCPLLFLAFSTVFHRILRSWLTLFTLTIIKTLHCSFSFFTPHFSLFPFHQFTSLLCHLVTLSPCHLDRPSSQSHSH